MVDSFTLLEIAGTDLNSAKILLTQGLYSQSVFYTQQCVEKISKYIAVDSKLVSFEGLQKEISHNSLQTFKVAITKKKDILEILKVFNQKDQSNPFSRIIDLDELPAKVSASSQAFENINSHDLQNLDDDHLKLILEMSDDMNEHLSRLETISLEEISGLNMDEFKSLIEKNHSPSESAKINLTELLDIKGTNRSYFNAFFKKRLSDMAAYLRGATTIFFMSLIFCRHAVSARYPDQKSGFNPLDHYTLKSPLINRMPAFHLKIENAIHDLKRGSLKS